LGIKADGDLILLVIDGCEQGYETEHDSAGATLSELIQALRDHGAVDAINLSGEGSSQLFINGGIANVPSERRGQSHILYERMLPSIGIVN
jgi:exopolysaccharide biosynthesis protein